MHRHGLHLPHRHLSRHPQANSLKKEKGQESPFLATIRQWYPLSSLALSIACERKLGSNLLFSSAPDTDSKELGHLDPR